MKRSEASRFARLSALLAFLLAAATGGIYLQRKWIAHRETKTAPPAPPVDVERQSSGITFSQGDGEHITYTVHASKSTDFRGQDASLLEEVVVTADETGAKKLSFVYPEGPAQPRLERDLIVAAGARRSRKRVEPADSGPAGDKERAPEP